MRTISYNEVRQRLKQEGVPDETVEMFITNYSANPTVWREFEKKTLAAIAAGRRVGAKCIWEAVRYSTEVEQKEDWKCNNSFTSYYARVFAYKYPEHADYFEYREVKGIKQAA